MHRFPQTPLPAPVMGEHAVGFEHVAMVARPRQQLVAEHFVERRLEIVQRFFQLAHLERGIVGHQLGHDDARLVQHHMAERDPFRDRLADDHLLERPR